jgi:hypothetical protein
VGKNSGLRDNLPVDFPQDGALCFVEIHALSQRGSIQTGVGLIAGMQLR